MQSSLRSGSASYAICEIKSRRDQGIALVASLSGGACATYVIKIGRIGIRDQVVSGDVHGAGVVSAAPG